MRTIIKEENPWFAATDICFLMICQKAMPYYH